MSAPPPPCDWQTTPKLVKERGQYLLETSMWSDCRFIVGTEPNQQVLEGHKLFLAMSSPVFEAMFYGGMAEKDPIAILDVQPDAFRALLEYIYTDRINLTSFNQVCELSYCAKKYMLPHLLEECTKYLLSNLYPENVCRAYELAQLFDEPILMEKCMDIIRNKTGAVLSESSFEDVALSTIIMLFEQEELNINTELQLFHAIIKYEMHNGGKVPILEDGIGNPSKGTTTKLSTDTTTSNNCPTIRDALKKIRFLTLTPKEFAEVAANTNLLSKVEKFSILMKICSPKSPEPFPEGFCQSSSPRKMKRRKAMLWIPGKRHLPNQAILNLMERQNPGLLSSRWGILERKEEPRGLRLVIWLDERSENLLKEMDFQPYIKATRAEITFLGSGGKRGRPDDCPPNVRRQAT